MASLSVMDKQASHTLQPPSVKSSVSSTGVVKTSHSTTSSAGAGKYVQSSPSGSPSLRQKITNTAANNMAVKPIPILSISSFYELSAYMPNGRMDHFEKYHGKVSLVVNMASCDKNTKQELIQLNDFATTYGPKGLVVMAFPCNQFGKLEPLDNDEIPLFLQNVRPGSKFEPKFTIYFKIDINGSHSHPVFEYLKVKQPLPQDDDGQIVRELSEISWQPVCRSDVSWNYEKFLVSHDGQPIKRYNHKTATEIIKRDLESALRRIPKATREALQLHH
ncbi:glutathione peroxidase 2-like [Saccostrea echinata]|uniref:glutathione peroxidase 2-like n=1 Tax=Saccostrea echinata TaxID=191078 RepID=UPI002A82B9F9|nr:glutathione peroxidase 2-like [Saccostrea echinata]